MIRSHKRRRVPFFPGQVIYISERLFRWGKSDGSPDWPTKANNGFDGGDGPPKVTELQLGQTFDRYGGRFDEKGNLTDQGKFVAPEDVPFEQRALVLLPKSAVRSQLPQPQVTATLGSV
ncbi:MAG: hypothetical protein ACRDCY_10235 [Aeromonas veronii]